MDHSVAIVSLKYLLKISLVADVGDLAGDLPAGDRFDPLQAHITGIRQIINDDNVVTGFQKRHATMRTNVAGAACDEYCHMTPVSSLNQLYTLKLMNVF